MRPLHFLLALQLLYSTAASAAGLDSPVGLWEAFDPGTGKAMGLMRVYQQGDLFFGRSEAMPQDHTSARCTRCKDERKDQPVNGLVVMRNMRLDKDEYSGGDILDPRTGGVYSCKFHLTDNGKQMVLRGFLGVSFLGGTQLWRRIG